MNPGAHRATDPRDRLPLLQKIAYGLGAFTNNLLSAAIGGMTIVLNLGLGMNPALVGLLSAIPRLVDAFTDPLVGYLSDHTRSRWGRRRPWIFVGAIFAAVSFALLWQLPEGRSEDYYFWFFLIGSLLFYLAHTVFATPWVALGYELTPDYHERTRIMAVQNFIGQLAYLVAPWFLVFMQHELWFDNMVEGAAGLALAIAVAVVCIGVLPAVFLVERFRELAASEQGALQRAVVSGYRQLWASSVDFGRGFFSVLKCPPFARLCAATFLIFNGFMMISAFQSYVTIFYVFGGDTDAGAVYIGYVGTVSAAATFCVILVVSALSTRLGKRRAFFVCTGLSIVGYLAKWFCYNPAYPWLLLLPAPLIAFGLGGLFTLMPSMIADVCDYDELETRQRREGMFGSIYWWVVKLGMATALALGGVLLNATGFDVALEGKQTEQALLLMRIFDVGFPALASALAIAVIVGYPITENRAHEIRGALEARRGTVN